ncbi:MAG: hypothetical protein KAS72_07425 [Phycisphaerales bacterium]|nr:hypothetical protein [Phycisphaerales bacterium]
MKIGISRWLTCTAALSMGVAMATQTGADDLSILRAVPEDAALVIYTPSLAQLERKVDAFAEQLGVLMPMSVRDMRVSFGLDQGFDGDGPLAIVLTGTDWIGADDPPVVFVASVTNYADFVGAFGAEPSGDIDVLQMPDGEEGYAKLLGSGFAAIGPVRDAIESFTPSQEVTAIHLKKLGSAGVSAAQQSVVSVLVLDVAAVQEIQQGLQQQMMGMMPMGPGMGEENPALDALAEATTSAVIGLNTDQLGVSIHMAATFKEGSELRKLAGDVHGGSALFRSLPDEPFLFAMAMDMSVQGLLQEISAAQGPNFGTELFKQVQGKVTTMESAFYPSPMGLMGGILSRGVSIMHSEDPDDLFEAIGEAMHAIDGTEQDGVKIKTSFVPSSDTIGGGETAKYSVRMIFPPEMAQAGQMMMGLYGGPGPNGFVVAGEHGVVQTMGQHKDLAEAALAQLTGDGGRTLGQDTAINQIRAKLPKERCVEAYMGVGELLEMALPMAAMFLGGTQIEIPEDLPPAGFGMKFEDGGTVGTAFVPMQIIQAVYETVQTVMQSMNAPYDDFDDSDFEDGEDDGDSPF